ncbi:hypothetical protein HK405_011372 [Cladochytrium tenue]|nr:hypothetical protein HK405_011372 [Cladochytrium tenue]
MVSILLLPPDVLLSVTDFLPAARDRTALGSACASLRRTLEVSLFSRVRCSSGTAELGASLVVVRYGHHVRRLRFECLMFENPPEDERDGYGDGEGGRDGPLKQPPDAGGIPPGGVRSMELSTTVAAMLRGEFLPNLDTLVVVFHPHDEFRGNRWVDDEYNSGGTIYISLAREDLRAAAKAEGKFRWRRLMARVWREIAANTKVRSLEIVKLPPNITTAWADAAWSTFVGNLERLTIGLWAGDNGAGWRSNTTEGYLQFLDEHLATFFFDNARGLQYLEIIAHQYDPFGGLFFWNATQSAFGNSNMPQLKELRMHDCVIVAALLDFLSSHAKVLKKLHLVDCMATTFRGSLRVNPLTRAALFKGRNPLTWADFFKGMYKIRNSVLSDLVVDFKRDPTYDDFGPMSDYDTPVDEDPRVLQARQKLSGDKTLKLFPYYYRDDKYGTMYEDTIRMLQRFESREDQIAYDRLVSRVKRV